MRVSLLTDAPKHNLALMKISAWHKAQGDDVILNNPLLCHVGHCFHLEHKTYASVLFKWNKKKFIADEYGGPAFGGKELPVPDMKPDYDLYPIDYSLGYTFRYCPRNCKFCQVTKIEKDKSHHSIWEFHDKRFKKIGLLNNNTFYDLKWEDTFHEIWDENITIEDLSGWDLRLINSYKANALKKTKWGHGPKFAWDKMKDEEQIVNGIDEINRVGFKNCTIYVLIGYDTTLEEDIYRCQKIHDMGHDPFPMIYENGEPNRTLHSFRRMIYQRYYRKEGNIEKAWRDYNK